MELNRLRVMVVDDNPTVAERIASLIADEPRIVVCDRVESGVLAFARIAADRPDAVLMDLEMPGIGGIEAIKRIKSLLGPPAIVVVTPHNSDTMRKHAMEAGADAFVPKSRVASDLVGVLLSLAAQADASQVVAA